MDYLEKKDEDVKVSRNHQAKIPSIQLPVTFEAGKGFVTAVFHIQNSTIGIRFEQPEQMLIFFTQLMKSAILHGRTMSLLKCIWRIERCRIILMRVEF